MTMTNPPAPVEELGLPRTELHGASVPVLGVQPAGTFYVRHGKRAFDATCAALAILVLAPVLAAVALVGYCSLGRPVFYRQVRLGRDARPFVMLKFRSMRHDRRVHPSPIAHAERRLVHKCTNDPRHTAFGRRIRRTSIDELPQLFNVLRGDMSIVGPRPELPHIAERHGLIGHVREQVRPGLTGLWQISPDRPGFVHENVRYDVEYVAGISFRRDLAIIARTIPVLLRGSGV